MVLLDFLKKFFRFTVSEETSFKTLFSFKIKLLSFLFYFLFFLMIGGLFYFILFSYTPLKKTIPGYKEILLNEEFLKTVAKKRAARKQRIEEYVTAFAAVFLILLILGFCYAGYEYAYKSYKVLEAKNKLEIKAKLAITPNILYL